jgi:hypothetical protein
VVPWSPPRAADGLGDSDVLRVQRAISEGKWRKSEQSRSWAGIAVASALGIDLEGSGTARPRVRSLLKTWLAAGVLKEQILPDEKRVPRPYIVVGDAACSTQVSVEQIQ